MSNRTPPKVDALGNLNPHLKEGLVLPVRDVDVNGAQIDIHAKTWVFMTSKGFSKNLTTDPNNALGLLLTLTETDVRNIGTDDYAIVDTSATPDDVRLQGRITPHGW